MHTAWSLGPNMSFVELTNTTPSPKPRCLRRHGHVAGWTGGHEKAVLSGIVIGLQASKVGKVLAIIVQTRCYNKSNTSLGSPGLLPLVIGPISDGVRLR